MITVNKISNKLKIDINAFIFITSGAILSILRSDYILGLFLIFLRNVFVLLIIKKSKKYFKSIDKG